MNTHPVSSTATTPATLVGAFWAYLLSTVAGLVAIPFLFAAKQNLVDSLRTADTAHRFTEDQLQNTATIGLTAAAVIAVVIALIYLLLAFKLKAGRNWARVVLAVLTVLHILSLVLGRGGSVLSSVSAAAAVIGLILAFVPASSAYVRARKRIS